MRDSKIISRIKIVLILVLPNLVMLILRSWISLDRPVIYYDYFLLIPLLFFNVNVYIIWLMYVFMIFADISTALSNLFLFNYADFIRTFKFFNSYDFSLSQILPLFCLILLLFFILMQLRRIKNQLKYDNTILLFFFVTFIIIFSLDFVNGSTRFESPLKKEVIRGNFASFTSPPVLSYFLNINAKTDMPKENKLQSVTFETFKNDSLTNQMLILVESFGVLKNLNDQQKVENLISGVFNKNNWKIKWGYTRFEGSTTKAELRELLNSTGDYRYLIRNNNLMSIFKIKNGQGYKTLGAHSYNGSMFERNIWWKNMGIERPFFKESIQQKNANKIKLNAESPFLSIEDETTFDFLQNESKKNTKNFAYLLTVNTHIPFYISESTNTKNLQIISNKIENVTEPNDQLTRIINFLSHVANNLDSNKFSKILIMGDHMPPFNSKASRSLYDPNHVPYCLIFK